MIRSLSLASVASYAADPQVLANLKPVNFLFGTNGSGKTTIAKVISDHGAYPTCAIAWQDDTPLQTMVYDQDFVTRNFSDSAEIRGIFTLGESNIATLQQIAEAKKFIDDQSRDLAGLRRGIAGDNGSGGKRAELRALESEVTAKCWAQKLKHDAVFAGAFEGFRNSKENFKDKILQESASNSVALVSLDELHQRAGTVFEPAPTVESRLPSLEAQDILDCEGDPILDQAVVGTQDVGLGAMIQRLGNSDWVRAGHAFYQANAIVCPFCQQITTDEFANSLKAYFDDAYEHEVLAIAELEARYRAHCERLQELIRSVLTAPSRFLDVDQAHVVESRLDATIQSNLRLLAAKKREPSQPVTLDSTANGFSAMQTLVDHANEKINAHNRTVDRLVDEKRALTAQVWKYLLEAELQLDLAAYKKRRAGLTSAIAEMEEKCKAIEKLLADKDAEVKRLEVAVTSVQPTIDAINALLSSVGFHGFTFARHTSSTAYKLVRGDGSDARKTLSEGEKSFVTFLYFYQLLHGSASESGVTADRVVVIDDPVSSLDSDITFVVADLIKKLIADIRSGETHIKQIFVLTHNVYFHREVTFDSRRNSQVALRDETFWTVRKSSAGSSVRAHGSNPVSSSYEMLWSEVKRPDPSVLTIQNTLRRIVENHFQILGQMNRDQICASFTGDERSVCRSLFSWVNAGSHYVHDDLYIAPTEASVDIYLGVFKKVFEQTGHSAHYRMMMGEPHVDTVAS